MLEAVTQVSSGDSFGELALMYDKPRQATIEALSDMHLVTLEKDDF
jgi:cAMP-dependent protein kinase regulator